jgi:lysophospholipase L1-like esterase
VPVIQQIQYFLIGLLTLPIFPVLFIQALRAKKRVGTLPDAIDPEGKTGGNSPALKVLVIGESTVAGVGVKRHEDGITGAIGQRVHELTGRDVNWLSIGGSGYTAKKVADLLAGEIPDVQYDYIVILLGGNETFELNSPLVWKKNLEELIRKIRIKVPQARVAIGNMPPVGSFTAFPKTLQWYLGGLVNLHRKVIKDLPARYDNLVYLSEPIDFDAWRMETGRDVPMKDFFSDGVHPSALTYKLWGAQIAERMVTARIE